jgi:hypothetical protein
MKIWRVEHETACRLDRAAHEHGHPAELIGQVNPLDLGDDFELDQEIGHGHVGGWPIENNAHRPFRRVGANINDRPSKAFIRHAGHGDEKLPVEVGGSIPRVRILKAHVLKTALLGLHLDHGIVDGRPDHKTHK